MDGRKRYRAWTGWSALFLILSVAGYRLLQPPPQPVNSVTVGSALGDGDHAGYQRAYAPRPLMFPADHGSHPEFRNEWWYVTGNLTDAAGRQFGYQLTLFRIALSPTPMPTDSAWRTNQVYMGHFALTDVAERRHYGFERFSRGALGLAGVQATPFRVWLDHWALTGSESDVFPLHVRAQEGDVAVDLMLNTAKPMVLQGDRGLSRKSAEPGNASYYYSYTRLPTQGEITIAGRRFTVKGAGWLDREWSTSALGPDQSGWDWFALQLDDGRDLMFYRLRRKDGGMDPFSKGVLVEADGRARPIDGNVVDLQPLGAWISPQNSNRYPAAWRLRWPAEKLDLIVTPKVADQEMRLTVQYWEGAVAINGTAGDRAITGQGYLEMTRYDNPSAPLR